MIPRNIFTLDEGSKPLLRKKTSFCEIPGPNSIKTVKLVSYPHNTILIMLCNKKCKVFETRNVGGVIKTKQAGADLC
jgi:hypothetical protein